MQGSILIVDDEQTLRMTFEALLGDAGYATRSASNFDDAVAALETGEFDTVIADIVLGGKSGIDLLERIQQMRPGLPVVMITGQPTVDTASAALRLGAHDFVVKPVNKDMLLRAARSAVGYSRLQRERDEAAAQRLRYQGLLEAIFVSMAEGLITIDNHGVVSQINPAAVDICGVEPGRALNTKISDKIWDMLGPGREMLRKAAVEGMEHSRKHQIVPSSGPSRVVDMTARPLAGNGGETLGALILLRDETRLSQLEDSLQKRQGLHRMIGSSPAMQKLYSMLETLAQTDTTVLIEGESGTGKELAAEAMHYLGPRADAPLVKVNCSALSENLLESELFGHVRGAFTGAEADKAGRFLLAHGGTILLDEIGDISQSIQVKLLRVLEDKIVERVGEAKPRKVDVRVVAATNRNLEDLVRHGTFRQDLYYRLRVVRLELEPLRERLEDLPLLASHFLDEMSKKLSKGQAELSPETMAVLLRHRWPGNVRELRHVLEHAHVFCRDNLIRPEHLPREMNPPVEGGELLESGDERNRIVAALEKAGGNKAKAARILGYSRNTIYRKLHEFNIPLV